MKEISDPEFQRQAKRHRIQLLLLYPELIEEGFEDKGIYFSIEQDKKQEN